MSSGPRDRSRLVEQGRRKRRPGREHPHAGCIERKGQAPQALLVRDARLDSTDAPTDGAGGKEGFGRSRDRVAQTSIACLRQGRLAIVHQGRAQHPGGRPYEAEPTDEARTFGGTRPGRRGLASGGGLV